MATEAVDSNARFTPDPLANAGYLYLRPGVKRGDFSFRVEQQSQHRALDYGENGELLGIDYPNLDKVNIGLLPQDDVIPPEKGLVTLLENSGVIGIEGTTRDLYRDWVSNQYSRVYDDGGIDACVDFFGQVVAYPEGNIDEHIEYAFQTVVPEDGKKDFRRAVADVIAQRLEDSSQPNLAEASSLIWLAVRTASFEASVPITNALINNPSLRDNKRIIRDGYHAVFWFARHGDIDIQVDVAREQAKRLIDSPEFDERYLPLGIKALLESDPFSLGEVLEDYRDRLTALKKDISQDGLWVQGYRSSNKLLIEGLREKGIELTSEQHAILLV